MKRSTIGHFAIIIGGLVLSLQLYGLKFLQGVDMQTGSWYTDPMSYFDDTPIIQSFILTICIIIYGIILINDEKIRELVRKITED